MRKLTSLLLIAGASFLYACGGTTPAAVSPAGEHAKPALKAPGEATIGDTTTCPVSGDEFEVTAKSPKVEHEGKTYYFCCGGCDKKFQADPAKYLTGK
jgi:Cu+-exporting ATPase